MTYKSDTSTWNTKKLKYVTCINSEVLRENKDKEQEISYIDISSVNSDGRIKKIEKVKFGVAPSRARRIVKKGDVIISTVRTYLRAIASIKENIDDLIVSTGFAVLRAGNEISPDFLKYAILNPDFIDKIMANSKGVSYPAISSSDLANLAISYPYKKETQDLISRYLNYKTSLIDSLVQKNEKLIKLLEEKKAAIISQTITKGLNTDVEMKDSVVEWVGKIPKVWKVEPVSLNFKENKIKNSNLQEKNLLSLSYGKIIKKNILSNFGLLPESFSNYQIVEKDCIILRLTDLQNDKRSLRVGYVPERGIITSAYIGLTPKSNLNSKYIYYLLHSYDLKKVFYNLGSGVRQSLTYFDFKKLPLIIPTSEEQEKIVEHVEVGIRKISDSINYIDKQIKLLEEYRKTLISNVVTGKTDVRDEKIPESGIKYNYA
ncbi:MAG: restriction endonuclease subunit S [Candidatus Shapirobacteria bacterium]|nr:restriction endonuclease subunit S [Candidatus Shapirobacteria bacterium]